MFRNRKRYITNIRSRDLFLTRTSNDYMALAGYLAYSEWRSLASLMAAPTTFPSSSSASLSHLLQTTGSAAHPTGVLCALWLMATLCVLNVVFYAVNQLKELRGRRVGDQTLEERMPALGKTSE